MSQSPDFDLQAAWLRRFRADAEGNLKAFALRLKEAMPDQVTIRESRSFFSGPKTVGVDIEIDESRYVLGIEGSQLKASIALVVRGITLNTRNVPPADWFARLAEETQKASEHAQALSRSLSDFMGS